jgi:L-serine deaminase
MISDDPSDIEAMTKAAHDAQLVMMSDWDHLPSDEYMDALRKTGYDIL